MVHHYKQLALIKIFFLTLISYTSLFSKEVPLLKVVSVNIPVGEYSVLDFPFEIVTLKAKTFKYKRNKTQLMSMPSNQSTQLIPTKDGITLSKKNDNTGNKISSGSKSKPGKNVLGLEKGKNVIVFRPKHKGSTELIIWGYKDFPIMLKINVTDIADSDKHIKFVKILDDRKDVENFESKPHEKIIELITRHLYDESYKSKPAGYESIVRRAEYNINVKDRDGNVIAILHNSLIREIVGRDYLGEVWNVNLIGNANIIVPKGLEVNITGPLYGKADGIYGVSPEHNYVTSEHGTRVMIVRRR